MAAMTRTELPETWDERTILITFLDYARATVHAKCAGVSETDARRAPPATPLMTISGLVSHLRWVEYSWFQLTLLGEHDHGPWTRRTRAGRCASQSKSPSPSSCTTTRHSAPDTGTWWPPSTWTPLLSAPSTARRSPYGGSCR